MKINYFTTTAVFFFLGSRPGSTDGDGFHPHPHHGLPLDNMAGGSRHPPHRQHMAGGLPNLLAGSQEVGLPVAPRIRALQNKLKMVDTCDAQGSLV
jgi:hypothetical protein